MTDGWRTINIRPATFARLQEHGYGFRSSPRGTPDKVINALIDDLEAAQAALAGDDDVPADADRPPGTSGSWGEA